MRTFFHFSVRWHYLVTLAVILALSLATMGHVANSVDYLRPGERTNGNQMLALFEPVTQQTRSAVVEVVSDSAVVSMGTVVSPLGYIVAKETEIGERPMVRLPGGQVMAGKVLATDPLLDLALLVVPGARLRAVRWGRSESLKIGDWVVSPGQEKRSWVGVISAKRREIKRVGGALGVRLAGRGGPGGGVEILAVVPDSPADEAGLAAGDLVMSVGGEAVRNSPELIARIQEYDPGQEVVVDVVRDGVRVTRQVVLGFYSIFDEFNRNQMMSGKTSDRRNGFPEVIQHAIPLAPNAMGSPLLNLRGDVVGINIARADRVTTYALPAERVLGSVRGMIQRIRNGAQLSLSAGDRN